MEIFPKEILEHTTQYFVPKNTVRSKAIYGILLLLLVMGFGCLPFVGVTIYTSARGFIKPNKERVAITSINSGKVVFTRIINHEPVVKGDTLLILLTNALDDQLALHRTKMERLSKELKDLDYLVQSTSPQTRKLVTPKYQKEVIQYHVKLTEYQTKLQKLKVDFERNKKLLEKGVIARAEFEDIELDYELSKNALYQFQKTTISSWQANLVESKNVSSELENSIANVLSNKSTYIITAPTDGTLLTNLGLEKGSYINSGIVLGELTPNTELIVECYVSPSDIGLIDTDDPVNFQVDAFNYNQWGVATGYIQRIGEDVEFMKEQPVYKVQCALLQKQLWLKNGYPGNLSKGMTLNARFQLAERTLYQLLYDKVDDWLNPTRNELTKK